MKQVNNIECSLIQKTHKIVINILPKIIIHGKLAIKAAYAENRCVNDSKNVNKHANP